MSRTAYRDLARLARFLVEKNAPAASRAADVIVEAVHSLASFPERGHAEGSEFRELIVRFGRDGYVLRYRVRRDEVLVTRIFHGKERR
jgi:plasmid stabilization system protein ParE